MSNPHPTSPPPLRVLVMPVSGSRFPVQLGILAAIADVFTGSKPDIVVASSGGNIAAYTALAADWSRCRMYSIVDFFTGDSFLANWYDHVPSWVLLALIPFSKSAFRPGFGFESMFKVMFAEGFLRSTGTEIWTGTFNRTKSQQQLFTNKAKGSTHLAPTATSAAPFVGIQLLPTPSSIAIPPIYADGDRALLAKAALASASIPLLVQPVVINGDEYSDGGTTYASPLSILDGDIFGLSTPEGGGHTLRLIYISPISFDISLITGEGGEESSPSHQLPPSDDQSSGLRIGSSLGIGDFNVMLKSMHITDVRTFVNLVLKLWGGSSDDFVRRPDVFIDITSTQIHELFTELDASNSHYAVLLFPRDTAAAAAPRSLVDGGGHDNDQSVDLTHIKPENIKRVMKRVEQEICAFVWKKI